MQPGTLRCPACGTVQPAQQQRYCLHCGEPVAADLIRELQGLHRLLGDLTERIAAGQGDETIAALRDEYRTRYLTQRNRFGIRDLPPAMQAAMAACQHQNDPHSPYCLLCGQAIGPELVQELQWLYQMLPGLDARIASGQEALTVRELLPKERERYLALRGRRPPAPNAAPPAFGAAPPAAVPPAFGAALPNTPAPPVAASPAFGAAPPMALPPLTAATLATGGPIAVAVATADPGAPPAGPSAPPASTSSVTPRRRFSWRAFFADQSIALIAYTGAFLLLLAALIFEVGSGIDIIPQAKLIVVAVTYVVFGALGFALRRSPRMFVVSRAYQAIFALLTPLMALAVYLFALKGLGIPGAGVVCISAWYAAMVYYFLARQTRLEAFTYLGAGGVVVAMEALPPWLALPQAWWAAALAVAALCLFAPRWLRWNVALTRPSVAVAGVAGAAALLGAEIQGLAALLYTVSSLHSPISLSELTATLGALTLLALLWALTLRDGQYPVDLWQMETLDWLVAVMAAQTVAVAAALAGVPRADTGYVLAGIALAEFGAALVVGRWQPTRVTLRRGVEGVALIAGGVGAVAHLGSPAPDWPTGVALVALALTAGGVAVLERQEWWLTLAGIAASFAWYHLLAGVTYDVVGFTRGSRPADQTLVLGQFGGALLIWLAALTVTARKYAPPLYVVVLANALYVALGVASLNDGPAVETAVLAGFAAMALITGRREGEAIFSGVATGIFGVLAVLPYGVNNLDGLGVALTGVAAAAAALIVRAALGRRYALAPYCVAAFAAVVCGLQLLVPGERVPNWSAAGVTFLAAFLLAEALPAAAIALWEGQPAALTVPALLGALAVAALPPTVAGIIVGLVVIVVMIGGAIALRRARGRWWNVALLAGAVVGAMVVTQIDDGLGSAALTPRIILLAALAVGGAIMVRIEPGDLETLATAALLPLGPLALAASAFEPLWWLTLVLAAYGFGGLVVQRRTAPGFTEGIFGTLAVLPLTLLLNGSALLLVAGLLPSLLALIIRRVLGRDLALLPYALAVVTTAVTAYQLFIAGGPNLLGVTYLAGFLALASVPAALAAAQENTPWALAYAAVLWLAASYTVTNDVAQSALVLIPALLGVGLRRWRGRWWDVPCFASVAVSSVLTVAGTAAGDLTAIALHAGFLAALALIGYTAVALEGVERETIIAAAAMIFLPIMLAAWQTDATWIYTLVFVVEALVMVLVGIGMRGRAQQVIGSGVLGVAVVRVAVLATTAGVPVAVSIAGLAVLLLGAATWLSLRRRTEVAAS